MHLPLPPSTSALTGSDSGGFQEDTVVNIANEAVWLGGTRPLPPQEVEDTSGQLHMFTVFNELTQMRQTCRERTGMFVRWSFFNQDTRGTGVCLDW